MPINYDSSPNTNPNPCCDCRALPFQLIQIGLCFLARSVSVLNFQGGSNAALSLPVWAHPSLWWIPVGHHSGPCHLFKVCHSGLGGPLPWQDRPFSRCDVRSAVSLSPTPIHHELSAGVSIWNLSIWDGGEICQKAQCFAIEPGTGLMCPAVMNPARSSSPGIWPGINLSLTLAHSLACWSCWRKKTEMIPYSPWQKQRLSRWVNRIKGLVSWSAFDTLASTLDKFGRQNFWQFFRLFGV